MSGNSGNSGSSRSHKRYGSIGGSGLYNSSSSSADPYNLSSSSSYLSSSMRDPFDLSTSRSRSGTGTGMPPSPSRSGFYVGPSGYTSPVPPLPSIGRRPSLAEDSLRNLQARGVRSPYGGTTSGSSRTAGGLPPISSLSGGLGSGDSSNLFSSTALPPLGSSTSSRRRPVAGTSYTDPLFGPSAGGLGSSSSGIASSSSGLPHTSLLSGLDLPPIGGATRSRRRAPTTPAQPIAIRQYTPPERPAPFTYYPLPLLPDSEDETTKANDSGYNRGRGRTRRRRKSIDGSEISRPSSPAGMDLGNDQLDTKDYEPLKFTRTAVGHPNPTPFSALSATRPADLKLPDLGSLSLGGSSPGSSTSPFTASTSRRGLRPRRSSLDMKNDPLGLTTTAIPPRGGSSPPPPPPWYQGM